MIVENELVELKKITGLILSQCIHELHYLLYFNLLGGESVDILLHVMP